MLPEQAAFAWWLAPFAALCVSVLTSMVGVSGAFLLLPFQMSVLGVATPGASATNLVYNLVAIPSGVYRYAREGRLLWPLTLLLVLAGLPGMVCGIWLRLWVLRDPAVFKLFVGTVLFALGARLLQEGLQRTAHDGTRAITDLRVRLVELSTRRLVFRCGDTQHQASVPALALLAAGVGVIGGIYGLGGGAIIAPALVALFRLPVYAVAGAALTSTFVTSALGIVLFLLMPAPAGIATQPDWMLGLLFGAGGVIGMYSGARLQRRVPPRPLRLFAGLLVGLLGLHYALSVFRAG